MADIRQVKLEWPEGQWDMGDPALDAPLSWAMGRVPLRLIEESAYISPRALGLMDMARGGDAPSKTATVLRMLRMLRMKRNG